MSVNQFFYFMFATIFIAIVVGLLIRHLLLDKQLKALKHSGDMVEGEITEVGRIGDLMEGICVTYRYMPKGHKTFETRTEEYSFWFRPSPKVGARYPVVYDPKDQYVSRILIQTPR